MMAGCKALWLIVLALLPIFLPSNCIEGSLSDAELEDYFYVDKSKWVDPGNMFTYDHRTKSNVPEPNAPRIEHHDELPTIESCLALNDKHSQLKEKLQVCRKDKKILESLMLKKSCSSRTDAFFRRLMNKAATKIDQLLLEAKSYEEYSNLHLYIQITPEEIEALQKLKVADKSADCNLVEMITDAATGLIDSLELGQQPTFLENNFEYIIAGMAASLISYAFVIRQGWFHRIILLLTVGTFWEWKRMYQMEIAKRHEMISNVASECLAGEAPGSNWGKVLLYWAKSSLESTFVFKSKEVAGPCSAYYRSVAVDPILEVNPIKALVHVFSTIIFYPLSEFGDYAGHAIQRFFQHIPFAWIPFILPSALLVVIIIILVLFRYSMRIPWFFVIEPASSSSLSSSGVRTVVNNYYENLPSIGTKCGGDENTIVGCKKGNRISFFPRRAIGISKPITILAKKSPEKFAGMRDLSLPKCSSLPDFQLAYKALKEE